MRLCRLRTLAVLVVGALVAAQVRADTNEARMAEALAAFTGAWEIASVHPEGATRDARRLVFNEDGTYSALDKNGKSLWAGTFEINPTTIPKVWDHRSHEAPKEGKDVLGIYELVGDTLKVACVVGQWKDGAWNGKPRLTEFDPEKADVMLELERTNAISISKERSQQERDSAMSTQLPEIVRNFVQATNENNPAGFVALFDEDAVVNDVGRVIQGREAIREWAESDVFAVKVKYDVLEAQGDKNKATFTAEIEGTFDRTGLPDPLIMTLQLAATEGKIQQLTCRLAEE